MNIVRESRETAEALRKFWKSNKQWNHLATAHYDDFIQYAADSLKVSPDDFLLMIHKAGAEDLLLDILYGTFAEKFFYDDKNVVNAYLMRRKWKHTPTAVTCLEQSRDRFFSIYEVTKVDSGKSITIKDYVFKTKAIEVLEQSGSICVNAGELIVAKIIEINGNYFFSGCILKIIPDFAEWFRDDIKELLRREKISITKLKNMSLIPIDLTLEIKPIAQSYAFTMFTTALAHLILPPKILTNEGEELRITRVNFKIKDMDKVLKALSSKEYFDKHDKNLYIWYEPATGMERRVLAEIRIKKDKLFCLTNSESRAKKLISILQDLASDGLSIPVTEHENINREKSIKKLSEEDEIPDDVKKRVVGNYLHENLKASLDIKIPMLENKTPRQCVKTNKNLVIGWLMMMEDNINQQIPGGDYDISWAYEELGLKR